ncbi:MerR family transcriptional regulator [Anaeromassilibacillus senegalensis]|uniref:MerR family transcriptional regulator n=1 Tax=Anaeromassilibacillus senegalensis TaxID=1673717 RepID=UPI0006825261|nr:MerR family transcriptional regulator [Anaeromassilibacillus senegalensis]
MMTVKQVSSLTGVSVRTLQFYDEIDLLKPAQITEAGYRLYDDQALEKLQQILFFKELAFTLKEIKAIMENPRFDKAAAYQKQRELIQIKRDRLDALLALLDRLVRGETCMDFKEFDMSQYFRVLNDFKKTHAAEIVEQLGSMERFNEMVADLESRKHEIADGAVQQYGNVETYTEAMKQNLKKFLEHGPTIVPSEVEGLLDRGDILTKNLTADLHKDPASPEIQKRVTEFVSFVNESNKGIDMGENYWPTMAETYCSSPVYQKVIDQKYGEGASKFIGLALKAYLDRQ